MSGGRSFLQTETGFCDPLLEKLNAVMAPEGFPAENEKRHTENMVGGGFLLAAFVGLAPFALQVV
jgi:hypothetical protein